MKIVEINCVNKGSTGNIASNICKVAEKNGIEAYFAYGQIKRKRNIPGRNEILIGSYFSRAIHAIFGRVLGIEGTLSYFSTKKLVRKLRKINPDLINIHLIHAWFINFKVLFEYLKKSNVKVVWTMHDCWAFTGRCPHFVISKCEKWKTGCSSCDRPQDYSYSLLHNEKWMWNFKKKYFTCLDNMTVVTPSDWLAGLVRQSYFGKYPVQTINNGIDLNVFRPTDSDFRERYGLQNKNILLGVSFIWGYPKGMDVFVELSKRLPNEYQIVLVGTDDNIDKILPKNIISIHRTQNQKELIGIYSSADLFVNPTREENYPTVNMEALACGTPVLTFETGGSPEIPDETCGAVVESGDVDALEKEIKRICSDKPFSKQACLDRAKQFDMYDKFDEYVKLYKDMVE